MKSISHTLKFPWPPVTTCVLLLLKKETHMDRSEDAGPEQPKNKVEPLGDNLCVCVNLGTNAGFGFERTRMTQHTKTGVLMQVSFCPVNKSAAAAPMMPGSHSAEVILGYCTATPVSNV